MKSGPERMRATDASFLRHTPTAVDRIPKPETLSPGAQIARKATQLSPLQDRGHALQSVLRNIK
jgi:hypothetical protein